VQARRLARQWLVNDLAGVATSIWYGSSLCGHEGRPSGMLM
jgi:hypothetical protein